MKKRLISIVVPVYNEQDCLEQFYERTSAVMGEVKKYDYEIVFFDDGSTDQSREMIADFCSRDDRCKAVFFARNYGYNHAVFYAMQQAKGDCAVLLHADLQNPPELIPELISTWEKGHDVVLCQKNKSKENQLMFAVRTLFYFLMNAVFGMHLIPHATDFGLADRAVIRALGGCAYREPFLRALLLKFARNKAVITYTQDRRFAGKTHFTFKQYYDLALTWIIFSSKVLPRRFLCVGIVMFFAGGLELCFGFLPHLKGLDYLAVSTPLLVRIACLVFSAVICFVSIMSEYLIAGSNAQAKETLIVEEKRINY